MSASETNPRCVRPVGQSRLMQETLLAAEDVAPTTATVLLSGESGTGKEVLARYIHALSPRASGPWVAINCAALPGELLEAELFGYERGAFTGATERRPGKMEQAHGGTLLLDEVSELPLGLQAKLLRALQEREVDRLGGRRPVEVDVRVIATSNRDLLQMVQRGQFRTDLFYRLNVFPIELPALRRRAEDIPLLTAHLLEQLASSLGRQAPELTDFALSELCHHPFPGNVRELSNVLHRALVSCRGPHILPKHLGLTVRSLQPAPAPHAAVNEATSPGGFPAGLPLDIAALERLAIDEALRRENGNRTHAASLLGISLRTLRNKLRQHKETTGLPSMNPEGSGSLEGSSAPWTVLSLTGGTR